MPGCRFGTLVIAFVFCAGLLFVSLPAASQAPATTDEKSVGQLAQRRFEVATKGYEWTLKQYKAGLGSAGVSEWLRRRAVAAQDLPNPADRVAALQDNLRQLKENLTRTERAMKAGTANSEDLLVAQYDELEGELWLAKAQIAHIEP